MKWDDKSLAVDDGEKADILNSYFANIGENLVKLPKPTDLITEDPEKPHVPVLSSVVYEKVISRGK